MSWEETCDKANKRKNLKFADLMVNCREKGYIKQSHFLWTSDTDVPSTVSVGDVSDCGNDFIIANTMYKTDTSLDPTSSGLATTHQLEDAMFYD